MNGTQRVNEMTIENLWKKERTFEEIGERNRPISFSRNYILFEPLKVEQVFRRVRSSLNRWIAITVDTFGLHLSGSV